MTPTIYFGRLHAARARTRIGAAAGAVAALLAAACADGSGNRAPESAANMFNEAAWKAPTEADIPTDSMGASIKRGLYLLRFMPESLPEIATSNLRCTSCHQNDGLKATAAPLTGSHARYPKYMPRSGAVVTLADRVNFCITRSLAGNAIPTGSREMEDMLAYLAFISKGVPVGTKIAGADGLLPMKDTLPADTARGRVVYETSCIVCHQKDGGGMGSFFPALWGPKSYSIGASMARVERAASFISHNMPQTSPGSLSAQQAFDVAAFINSHERPDSPGKADDWPLGGGPKDVPYSTKGHTAYNPPARLVPRATPERALVPPPASVKRETKGKIE